MKRALSGIDWLGPRFSALTKQGLKTLSYCHASGWSAIPTAPENCSLICLCGLAAEKEFGIYRMPWMYTKPTSRGSLTQTLTPNKSNGKEGQPPHPGDTDRASAGSQSRPWIPGKAGGGGPGQGRGQGQRQGTGTHRQGTGTQGTRTAGRGQVTWTEVMARGHGEGTQGQIRWTDRHKDR